MALRRLNIDFEALARAMARQGSDENDYYLDTHTGRIMRISTDVWNALEEGETIAGSLNAWQQEELHMLQALDGQMRKAFAHSQRAQLYLHGRGIRLETALALGVGYLPSVLLNRPEMRKERALLRRWVDRLLFPLN